MKITAERTRTSRMASDHDRRHHPPPTPPTPLRRSRRAPACVMSFNASDPSGAGGLAGDVATIAAMGAHALPVVTGDA